MDGSIASNLATNPTPSPSSSTPSTCDSLCTGKLAAVYLLYTIYFSLATASRLTLFLYAKRRLSSPSSSRLRSQETNTIRQPCIPLSLSSPTTLAVLSTGAVFGLTSALLLSFVELFKEDQRVNAMALGAMVCAGLTGLDTIVFGVVWIVGRRKRERERKERRAEERVQGLRAAVNVELQNMGLELRE
ncbi:hypothetical protein Slin15195_G046590 [Septoria linicola]|uniref:Uncharacterized protein n=1 Tax=Septoria linicola TaxID=215465 RepID=A0A9Q9ARR9_9PEZI|nr:hypothetical protein Slin15195_G046590 [Septoria linicola]